MKHVRRADPYAPDKLTADERRRLEAMNAARSAVVTPMPVRDALVDLVRLKDLKQWIEADLPGADEVTKADAKARYEREKEPAWEAARLALEATPSATTPTHPISISRELAYYLMEFLDNQMVAIAIANRSEEYSKLSQRRRDLADRMRAATDRGNTDG